MTYIRIFQFILIIFWGCPLVAQTNGIVINQYAAITSYLPCSNTFTVDSSNNFYVGDTILMIQMKGATIDTSNTSSFGNIMSYNSCGNYEYNVIQAISGTAITLKYVVARTYDIPNGKVQMIRVPSFINYTINQQHTCMPWNGVKGGVLVMHVQNTLTLNDTINVSANGFRGGTNNQNPTSIGPVLCTNQNFYMSPDFDNGSMKGEGIAEVSLEKSYGRGRLGNGGGGGNAHNAGGAGGSNGNIGGGGGSEYQGCNNIPANNVTGGIGGTQLTYSNANNKIFLGGGGGSAQTNNLTISNGGNGGGICIITAGSLIGNSGSILANGQNGLQCINNGSFGSCHDGMAGGGGGGTILINIGTASIVGLLNVESKGGKGADETADAGYYEVGPGGGGGGGIIWYKSGASPTSVTNQVNGGANGIVAYSNETWDAHPGLAGQILNNLNFPFPTDTFTNANITSNFTSMQTSCFSFHFTDQSLVTSGTITTHNWNFGDGTSSTLSNPNHTYQNYGSYAVTLTVTDMNGCSSTLTQNVTILYQHFAQAEGDTTTCGNRPLPLHASGGASYQWSPASGLNDPSSPNPTVTINATTHYQVTVTDTFGCTDIDSVNITIIPAPTIIITPNAPKICGDGSVQLHVSGIDNAAWSPANSLSNASILDPVATPPVTTNYIVTGTNAAGCSGTDSVTVSIYPTPDIEITADNDTISCTDPVAKLTATGGVSYIWSPVDLLNNPTIQNPIARLTKPTEFFVEGTDINGCKNIDSIYLFVSDNKYFHIPNAFSPNGDGRNDVFLPLYECDLTLENFSIYNRFGQRIFYTMNKFKGWDGFQNLKPADMGTYYWYIQGVDPNNKKITKRGDVALIR